MKRLLARPAPVSGQMLDRFKLLKVDRKGDVELFICSLQRRCLSNAWEKDATLLFLKDTLVNNCPWSAADPMTSRICLRNSMTALRDGFGLTDREARVRLADLRHSIGIPRMVVSHSTKVTELADIVCMKLPHDQSAEIA